MALGKTREEMLAGMSSAEYSGWLAFNSLEPIGERRADLRAGSIVSAIFKSNWASKSKKPPTVAECTFQFEPPQQQPVSAMKRILDNITKRKRK